jgi:hypothetical protein
MLTPGMLRRQYNEFGCDGQITDICIALLAVDMSTREQSIALKVTAFGLPVLGSTYVCTPAVHFCLIRITQMGFFTQHIGMENFVCE